MTLDFVNLFLDVWLKPMICLGLFLSISKNSFPYNAASNHWFLFCAILSCFLCGVFLLQSKWVTIGIVPASYSVFTEANIIGQGSMKTLFYCIVTLYLFITITLIFDRLREFFGLKSFYQNQSLEWYDNDQVSNLKNIWKVKNSTKVILDPECEGAMTWGWLNPIVLLPESSKAWSEARFERVLSHELVHIYRKDWLVKLFCQFVCIFFWFLPFVWTFCKKIEWYCELSCDDKVICRFDCREDYAQDLIELSGNNDQNNLALVLPFNRGSHLFGRIKYILDGRVHREEPEISKKLAMLVICLILVVPVFSIHAGVRPQELLLADNYEIHYVEEELKKENEEIPVLSHSILERPKLVTFDHLAPDSRPEEVIVWSERLELAASTNTNSASIGIDQISGVSDRIFPSVDIKGMLPKTLAMPRYPSRAIEREIEGVVIVQFDIGENGQVINPKIRVSQPENVFEKCVLEALKNSVYAPMVMDGKPIKIKNVTKTFKFKLHESTTKSPVEVVRPEKTRVTRAKQLNYEGDSHG